MWMNKSWVTQLAVVPNFKGLYVSMYQDNNNNNVSTETKPRLPVQPPNLHTDIKHFGIHVNIVPTHWFPLPKRHYAAPLSPGQMSYPSGIII